jgi:hypothetical protein
MLPKFMDPPIADDEDFFYPEFVASMSKFCNKESYKNLGARWNPQSLLWVWSATQKAELVKSLNRQKVLPSLLADSFHYVESAQTCWKCAVRSQVFCIACNSSMSPLTECVDKFGIM